MKEYIFVRSVPIINRDLNINEFIKAGTVRYLSDSQAGELMALAVVTPYKKPTTFSVIAIKKILDAHNISYTSTMKKDELLKLLEDNDIRQ